MRQFIALGLLGGFALIVQGALATFVSPPYCPDFALLAVVAIGLRWRGLALGLCLAALLGFAADLLSGSLMGQHALLRVIAFTSAYFAGRQLNLKGSLPLVVFAAAVTVVYGAFLFVISTFFVGSTQFAWGWLLDLLQHAAINGVVAPLVLSLVVRVASLAGEGENTGRAIHFDPTGGPA